MCEEDVEWKANSFSGGSGQKCFACGQGGHKKSDCSKRGGFSGGGGGAQRSSGPQRQGQSSQIPARGGRPPGGSGRGDIYLGSAPAPDPTVTAAEDALVLQTKGRTFDGFTGRQGYGTKGRKIILRTNYFKINTPFDSNDSTISEKVLYRYVVAVAGASLTKTKKRQLLEMIVAHSKFKNITWATDYSNIIVTTNKLDLGKSDEWKHTVTLPPPGTPGGNAQSSSGSAPPPDFVQAAQARNRITFKVTYSDSFSLQHIIDYLRSRSAGATYEARADVVQLLNVIICKHPQGAADIVGVAQNKFYPIMGHPGKELYAIGGGLEALRGYFTSVRPTINRLLLNINVTSGAFYKPIALLQLIDQSGASTLERREEFIDKLKVRIEYKKDNETKPSSTRMATIFGVARITTNRGTRAGNANEITFAYTDPSTPGASSTNISVSDYFRRVRGITLKRPEVPVLNIGSRSDPKYMPMELCTVLPGQSYNKLLGGNETGEMVKFAARPPNLNAMSIAGTQAAPGNGVRLFRLAAPPPQDMQLQSVKPFGLSVNTQMITVPGRILDGPQVNYKNSTVNPEKASWNCARQKFADPARFRNWQVLVINAQDEDRKDPKKWIERSALVDDPQSGLHQPENLFSELGRQLQGYGLSMGQREPTQRINLDPLNLSNRSTNDRKVRAAFQKAQDQKVHMLFVVLPENNRWLYGRIKFYGDVEFGVHCINAVGNKLQKPGGQAAFMANLALKFNVKGGGVTHKIPSLLSPPLDANTMLVGIDVTHPSSVSRPGAPSIACVVASVDEHLFQWPGSIRTQTGRVEMVQGLEAMVTERLKLWHKKHNRLPGKIILYRDGVSEGQYGLVLENELPSFKEAFKKAYGQEKNWPKMAIIIVGKRHHTRFYPTSKEDADTKSWNPLPGTVVDRGIVGPIIREFYLQAHQGLQGTVRPAHYVVIKDDIAFEADELEQFTLKMCYTFNRATKAVSICPPAYYADLLCERGRYYLFETLAENHGDNSTTYSTGGSDWTGGVHMNLADSTWYI